MAIASVTVVSLSLTVAAFAYPGFKTAEVDLNDGGVWVTSKARGAVGRLNYASKVLDGAVSPASSAFDILQSKQNVMVQDSQGSALSMVNPSTVRLSGDERLAGGSESAIGGDVVAVTDPAKGKVWAMKADALSGYSPEAMEPAVAGEQGIVAAVGRGGQVGVADPSKGVVTDFTLDGQGAVTGLKSYDRPELKGAGNVQLAQLGDKTVILDAARGKLILPGGNAVPVPDARDARLQQSGPDSDTVALATGTSLILQPLDGGQATTVDAGGTGVAAAPVQLNGCVYSAWSGSNRYVRHCTNSADDQARDVPKASSTPSFVFRVNRDLVVLNDVNAGTVWLVNQNMLLVDNWDDVIPPKNTSQDADKDSADEVQRTTLPDRTKPNTPPVCKPSSFGIRAGKTTILSVMDYCSDADGDVLRVHVDEQPSLGRLEPVYGNTGLQISVPQGKTGNATFKYSVDDGRGGTTASTITLNVIPPEENHPPRLKPGRVPSYQVAQGKQLVQNVLSDFMDPDGDDMFLLGATSSNDRDLVRTRPDGQLTFQDAGGTPGKRTVTLKVSDGVNSADVPVTVEVKAPGALPPLVNASAVTAVAGQRLVIAPLANDVDPLGGTLRLAQVTPDVQSSTTLGADQQTFAFSSNVVGTHYVTYMVTNGPAAAQQLVRVDVVPPGQTGAPVAVRDVALLPSGGTTLVDVLANDVDPAGGVLAAQSVTVPEGAPVNVAVMEHSVVKISDLRAKGTLTLKYTISNGKASATGEISVLVVPRPAKLSAPQAKPDEVTVRAGDVVSIPVLANDVDPNGGKLTLDPKLIQVPDTADGRTFVSGNTIRFLAGKNAKTVYAIYKVSNDSGQSDSAQVTIRIKARDDAHNARPEPKNVTARTLAGSVIKIPVPLDGIDPDGDSVELVGIDKAPALGTAVVREGYIEFTAAGNAAGTDTFTYRVRDRIGAENSGVVTVGIVPPATVNQKPIAVDDTVTVKPGRKVEVDVLSNDSDPDGDPIALVKNGVQAADQLLAEVSDSGKVLLTAPGATGTYNARYTIQDDKGAQASATVFLKVDPNAPAKAPVANDDFISPSETLGKSAVDIPVLKNDSNPGGVTADLKISFPDGNPAVSVNSAGVVHVGLTDQPQLIPYTVTNLDGLTATAIIHAPGLADMAPVLKKTDPVEVTAGQSVDLKLSDFVAVRSGRSPRITVVDKVRVIGAAGTGVVTGDGGTLHYAALKDFFGPGSVTFEVTDGSGPDDPQGLASTLTIMTKVDPDPNANHPPTFLGSSLDVPQGDAVELDLSKLATDPDPGDQGRLAFSIDQKAPHFQASLDGHILKVQSSQDAAAGTIEPLGLSVTDGRSPAVHAQVTLKSVSSTKAKAVVPDVTVQQANAGQPVTTDVLTGAVNPFPDTPLKITSTQVETGQATGVPSVNGGSLTVTPAPDFKGILVVHFVVADKTGDSSRDVDAWLSLTVRAAPDAPGVPFAADVRDKTAVLSWTPPSDNGAPITKYTVSGANGFSQECATTTCTLTGLTNTVHYRFTVVATNAVGDSKPSAQSNEVVPDVKPYQPDAPSVKAGNQDMAVSWTPARTDGSAVKSYNLEISPPPAGGVAQKTGVTGTSYTWPGLTNGVDYQVRIQAVNDAPSPSDWSAFSVADHPAAPPAQPQPPTTQAAASVGSQTQVAVNWTEPATNGDPIKNYYVTRSGGGQADLTVTAPGTSQSTNFTVANSQADYTFTVQAENKAGRSPASGPSAPRRATGKLATPQLVSVVAANTGGNGHQLQINFTPLTSSADLNGSSPSEVSYHYNASPSGMTGPVSSGQSVAGFPNGQQQTITVVADSTAAPSSDASNPKSATPYGAPGTASVTAHDGGSGSTSVSFDWSNNTGSNDVVSTEISFDGSNWQGAGVSGSVSHDTGGYNRNQRFWVRNVSSTGQKGNSISVQATSGAQPSTQVAVTAASVNSCTEPPTGGSGYSAGPPQMCYGVVSPGGSAAPGPWLYQDRAVTVDRCGSPWGTSGWYHISRGSYNGYDYTGRWVRANTTYVVSGPLRC
ncbi:MULTISPECIES: Ig-like domain-containing protein [Arthrobacter]|uniref:Ig-like domain-containing protein n=2 Tax=Arthrobacter TaxID=1663 RepID=A0ABU9KN83_9MICC|nr:Ig-like domain-containing protein [Arthrobacter sp. YJM1]MDP5228334.1 Ig-like domain-containing protein [Arthrobacter sp. YJM1]